MALFPIFRRVHLLITLRLGKNIKVDVYHGTIKGRKIRRHMSISGRSKYLYIHAIKFLINTNGMPVSPKYWKLRLHIWIFKYMINRTRFLAK